VAETGTPLVSDGVLFATGSLLAVLASVIVALVTLRVEGKRRADERQRWADEREDRARERDQVERTRLDAARVSAYATVLDAALSMRSMLQRARTLDSKDATRGGVVDRFSVAIFSAHILATPPTKEALTSLRLALIPRYRLVEHAHKEGNQVALDEAMRGFSAEYTGARNAFTDAASDELQGSASGPLPDAEDD